jgi:antitoxin FitA
LLAHVMHMWHPFRMAKMIQVRNVPDRLHRELVRRARARGETLTQYIEHVLEREVERPLTEEILRRIASRTPVELDRPVADLLREDRELRGAS